MKTTQKTIATWANIHEATLCLLKQDKEKIGEKRADRIAEATGLDKKWIMRVKSRTLAKRIVKEYYEQQKADESTETAAPSPDMQGALVEIAAMSSKLSEMASTLADLSLKFAAAIEAD